MTTPSETLAGIMPKKIENIFQLDIPLAFGLSEKKGYNRAIDDCHASLLKAIDDGKIKIVGEK